LAGITLEGLDDLRAQSQAYLSTPTGTGLSKAIGLGPNVAAHFIVMAALQGSTMLRAGDNARAYLSEMPELRAALLGVRDLSVMPSNSSYASVIDTIPSWKIGLGGFCDPEDKIWGPTIRAWTEYVVRDKWSTIMRSSFLNDDIPKVTDAIPPTGRSFATAARRLERMAYIIKYLMRRPGFRLMAHVLELLLSPTYTAYLKMRHDLVWPRFEALARAFLSKEMYPSLMNFGDEFVGSATFQGVGAMSVQGYIFDRKLWNIPLVPLPEGNPGSWVEDSELRTPGANGRGPHFSTRQIIDQWGHTAKESKDADPVLKRLFSMDEEIMAMWERAHHFLLDWENVRIEEEDVTTGNLATAAPGVWGMKPRPSTGTSRTLGSDLVDYTVLGGQYATGPASRNLKGMLVSPLLNYVIADGETMPAILWKSARSVCSLPFASMVMPKPGSAFEEKNFVYVEPQNIEGRHINTTDRFDPRTVRPVKEWKGELEFIPIPRSIEMLAVLAAFAGPAAMPNLTAAVEKHPDRWAHLLTVDKNSKLKLTPGGDLFESSLTKRSFLVPVAIPRAGLQTRVATWVGPPAGLRPFRGWITGADIEFTNLPYTLQVDVSSSARSLAEELAT